jgi:hypothetical protein
MAEQSRIDDLRRRVQKDPASIAFAQLAEECRRSGAWQEAVDTCRAGLEIHPGYLSARVTLGRALVEMGQLDEAQTELSRVLASAPENLSAIRGLAEIHHTRGNLAEALTQYRAALLLARNDPDLEETIADLSRQVEPAGPAQAGGLSLEHMHDELLKLAPSPKATAPQVAPSPPKKNGDGSHFLPDDLESEAALIRHFGGVVPAEKTPVPISQDLQPEPQQSATLRSFDPSTSSGSSRATSRDDTSTEVPNDTEERQADAIPSPWNDEGNDVPPSDGTLTPSADDRATRTVAALEQWLAAIHVSREERHA